jgi:predicted transcriptional regulator
LIVENPKEVTIEADKILNVLTQSSVISFVSKHLDALGDLGKQTINTSGLGIKKVMSVSEDAPAIDAFKMMAEHRITGVAVTHEDGELFTIISAKDIKVRYFIIIELIVLGSRS